MQESMIAEQHLITEEAEAAGLASEVLISEPLPQLRVLDKSLDHVVSDFDILAGREGLLEPDLQHSGGNSVRTRMNAALQISCSLDSKNTFKA